MSTINLKGATSGTISLVPTAIAGSNTLTLPAATGTVATTADIPVVATQANQETATSTTTFVSPGRQQYHPSAAKFWVRFNTVGTTTITASYNVASLTDNGTGQTTVNFTTAFSGASAFAAMGCAGEPNVSMGFLRPNAHTTTTFGITTTDPASGLADFSQVAVAGYGDQ